MRGLLRCYFAVSLFRCVSYDLGRPPFAGPKALPARSAVCARTPHSWVRPRPGGAPGLGAEDLNVMSFLFCLELSDIPVGPCRGLYILAAPPQVKSSSLRTLQRGGKRRQSRYQQQRHHPVWEEPSQGSDAVAAAASADPFGRCMDLALGVGGGGGADSDDDDDYQDL